MAKVYYGCDELRESWTSYFNLCNALELDLGSLDEPPRIDTLNEWRVESPRGFCFILHAQSAVGQLLADLAPDDPNDAAADVEFPDELRDAWDRTLENAHALAAKAILLQTPSTFTPGDGYWDLLERFSEEFVRDTNPAVLWEPSGLWTIEQTREAADRAGLAPVYDPFIAEREGLEFTHGDLGCVLTERAARRRQFDLFDVKKLIRWTEKYDRVFALLRGRHKWAHAQHFQTALQHEGLSEDA